jgi:TRAP-type C4-dicarboxylate transport system substrate-binding protein
MYTHSFWKDISQEAKEAFRKLFKESYQKDTTELSDFFGAVERAVSYARSFQKNSYIIFISPAIQEYNRPFISGDRLEIPDSVEKFVVLSSPYLCKDASESLKVKRWQQDVVDYWKSILHGKTVQFLYSY